MPDPVVHLHVHSDYSILDGLNRVEGLCQAAAADGQGAVALTDHGTLSGIPAFIDAAHKAGVRPIIGCELYMVADRHQRGNKLQRDQAADRLYSHLVTLVRNEQGWRNLIKLSSLAYTEGYYYKPRVDWELIERYHEGLIFTSSCLSGMIPQAILRGDLQAAQEHVQRFVDIVGRDSFLIEVQGHGIADQYKVNEVLVPLAKKMGLRVVATNDSHYTQAQDAMAHEIFLCIQTKATLANPKRFKFEGQGYHLKTSAEMRREFEQEWCDNTLWVADSVEDIPMHSTPLLPQFPCPPGHTADTYLRQLVMEGIRQRYGDNPTAHERAQHELQVIHDCGFDNYFLIVWDIVNHARQIGAVVGPGRGSAAGSIVSYALGITSIDPLRHGLIFERFLNPNRISMPDIDLDFDVAGRLEVGKWVPQRWGGDRCAQIVAFQTMAAKVLVRDVARALGYPPDQGTQVANMIPQPILGKPVPFHAILDAPDPEFEAAWDQGAALREEIKRAPDGPVAQIVTHARPIEGAIRHELRHAAGMIIAPDDLTNHLPVKQIKASEDDMPVSQWDHDWIEKTTGLLKIDLLGLRTLTVLKQCLENLRKLGVDLDLQQLDLDHDPEAYALIAAGHGTGIFQLEQPGIQELCRMMRPDKFADLVAINALYRPGPMDQGTHIEYCKRKNGQSPVTYLHPDMEAICADTYGLIIYQETIMQLSKVFAGFTDSEADELRAVCAKKRTSELESMHKRFVEGCLAHGYTEHIAQQLFDIIEPFSGYAFNKSHATGYATIMYWAAHLKAHYPAAFFAAQLSSVTASPERTRAYLVEARAMGVNIVPPDINRAGTDYIVVDEHTIMPGLLAIRSVGERALEALLTERQQVPIMSLQELDRRIPARALPRPVVEQLIKAGALDSLHPGCSRYQLLQLIRQIRKGSADDLLEMPDWAYEQEAFGFILRVPPDLLDALDRLRQARNCPVTLAQLGAHNPGEPEDAPAPTVSMGSSNGVECIALVEDVSSSQSKRGNTIGHAILIDRTGTCEALLFPSAWEHGGHNLRPMTLAHVWGRMDEGRLLVSRVQREIELGEPQTPLATIALPSQIAWSPLTEQRLHIIAKHTPGATPVCVVHPALSEPLELPYTVDYQQLCARIARAKLGVVTARAVPQAD